MKQIGNIMRYIVIVLLDIAVMLVFHSYINFLLLIGLILFPVCNTNCSDSTLAHKNATVD